MKNLRSNVVAALLVTALGTASVALAQAPTTGGPQPTTNNATNVPIDGGASLLLASGVVYSLRRLRRRKSGV